MQDWRSAVRMSGQFSYHLSLGAAGVNAHDAAPLKCTFGENGGKDSSLNTQGILEACRTVETYFTDELGLANQGYKLVEFCRLRNRNLGMKTQTDMDARVAGEDSRRRKKSSWTCCDSEREEIASLHLRQQRKRTRIQVEMAVKVNQSTSARRSNAPSS